MPALVRAAAAAYGDALAIVLERDGATLDALRFRELDQRSAQLARGLLARGVGKGTRVGVLADNGPFLALALAAIGRIGAVAIPLSTLSKADELVRALRQADVAGLIVQRNARGHDYVARLCDALPELRDGESADLRIARTPYLRWAVSSGVLPPSVGQLDALLNETVPEALLAEVESEVHASDQLLEIYTSGSMALPKGVKHSHGAVARRARYLASMAGRAPGQRVLATLPMFWVGGLMMFLFPCLVGGATLCCEDGKSGDGKAAFGAPPGDQLAALKLRRPYWALGMSETLGPYAYGDVLRAPGHPLCAPLDHFAEQFEVRLVDEHGVPVRDGEVGELQVRGDALTTGLHKIERAEHFSADGFYRTGDLGLREGERIHFVGRQGDLIKVAGANVSPLEVEQELLRFEGVRAAYVVGLTDPERGQVLAAGLVASEPLDFAHIERELKRRLSSYKVPRIYLSLTREEVPLLISDKVARRPLAALIASKLGGQPAG